MQRRLIRPLLNPSSIYPVFHTQQILPVAWFSLYRYTRFQSGHTNCWKPCSWHYIGCTEAKRNFWREIRNSQLKGRGLLINEHPAFITNGVQRLQRSLNAQCSRFAPSHDHETWGSQQATGGSVINGLMLKRCNPLPLHCFGVWISHQVCCTPFEQGVYKAVEKRSILGIGCCTADSPTDAVRH